MKYWVFGHTHDAVEYGIEDVKFLCNPLGYPNESEYGDNINMKSFEIASKTFPPTPSKYFYASSLKATNSIIDTIKVNKYIKK